MYPKFCRNNFTLVISAIDKEISSCIPVVINANIFLYLDGCLLSNV